MRSALVVPLLREGLVIGAISVARGVTGPFAQHEVGLLQTFADQAVIAIENTRLFEAEQASKRELQESLEYQTATSDVLAVISRSKFELQPVLDAIASVASRLCVADDALIFLREGTELLWKAHHGPIPSFPKSRWPVERDSVIGRAVMDRQTIQVPDLTVAGDEFALGRENANRLGYRTTLAVPLLRNGDAIGCLLLRRKVVQPFAEKQIALLETFADQAVIAIENTRLFEEEQARTRELTEALEHQTATARCSASSAARPTELQPVFEAIVTSASSATPWRHTAAISRITTAMQVARRRSAFNSTAWRAQRCEFSARMPQLRGN